MENFKYKNNYKMHRNVIIHINTQYNIKIHNCVLHIKTLSIIIHTPHLTQYMSFRRLRYNKQQLTRRKWQLY